MVQTAQHPPASPSRWVFPGSFHNCLLYLPLLPDPQAFVHAKFPPWGVPFKTWRGVKEGSIFFKPRAHSLNKTILRHLMCKTNPADPLCLEQADMLFVPEVYYPRKVREAGKRGCDGKTWTLVSKLLGLSTNYPRCGALTQCGPSCLGIQLLHVCLPHHTQGLVGLPFLHPTICSSTYGTSASSSTTYWAPAMCQVFFQAPGMQLWSQMNKLLPSQS